MSKRPRHRQRKAFPTAMSPGRALRWLLLPPPPPCFLHQVYQSVHDVFVRIETRGGHIYNRREEDVGQEGHEQATLKKALFHSEQPRAHPVAEPHACSHAIVELTNDQDQIMWYAKTGEYCPEEGSVNGVIRFGKIDEAYRTYNGIRFFRANSCTRRSTTSISVLKRFDRKPLCSSCGIPMRSQYSLRRRAMIFSSILSACATRYPCCCLTLSDPSFCGVP